jgi:aminomethyltransferase
MTVQLVSGLKPVDRSFESWWVRPGASTTVELRGDDRVTVIDPDGGQPAELTIADPGALGEAKSPIRLFGPDSRPGESQSFAVERDVSLTVAAPGGRVIDGDPPASALVVEIKRARPRPAVELELPQPLAEP